MGIVIHAALPVAAIIDVSLGVMWPFFCVINILCLFFNHSSQYTRYCGWLDGCCRHKLTRSVSLQNRQNFERKATLSAAATNMGRDGSDCHTDIVYGMSG